MVIARFDAWTRRRFGLAATGLGLVALSGPRPQDAAANKARKRRRRRCRKRKKGGSVTCADICPTPGGFAFHLIEGGDVCATGADPIGCVECDEDSDCATVGPGQMCAKDFTNLATGAVADFSGLCGAYTGGLCVVFEPCVLGS